MWEITYKLKDRPLKFITSTTFEVEVRNTESWGILYDKLFYGVTGAQTDFFFFLTQVNRPLAMNMRKTYEKLTQTRPWEEGEC